MIELTQGRWPFHVPFQLRHWTRSHGSCPSFGSVCSLITNHYPEILESGRRNIDKQHVLLLAKEWSRPRNTAWGWSPGWDLDVDCVHHQWEFPCGSRQGRGLFLFIGLHSESWCPKSYLGKSHFPILANVTEFLKFSWLQNMVFEVLVCFIYPLKRPWCWERLRAGGEWDDRGWDGWMASLTQWTWVWVHSGSW